MRLTEVIQLIKAIRIRECLSIVLLAFIGFKYSSITPNVLAITALFFVIACTMLQNDWKDRFHDLKKGKKFASNNPGIFFVWLSSFWIICVILILLVFLRNPLSAGLLLVLAFIGAIYSEMRKVIGLSVFAVTFTVAASTLLAWTYGVSFMQILPFFLTTALIMFGRETLHDIADVKADRGYKKTIPIVWGDKFARIIASISLIVGCGFAILISPVSIIGISFILFGLVYVMRDTRLMRVRRVVDIGLAVLMISLAIPNVLTKLL